MTSKPNSTVNRRRFLATAGASALGLTVLRPETVFSAEANARINLGLIGCGGRGRWIAKLFQRHGGFNLVGVADYFPDKADAAAQDFAIPAERRFTGLAGYQRLLEQKLDAVVIQTPPWFHPEQVAAAVAAGKHVYLAKPAAVDVPGCVSIEKSAAQAQLNKRVFVVDFQSRTHPLLKQLAQHIQTGDIGRIVSAEASYQTGPVGAAADEGRRADPKNPELRLRAWVTDRALSGDIITEQNIHALDMACWLLDAAPQQAYGTGGKTRDFVGDCWDHFSVIYQFPKGIVLTFSSKQAGFGYDDIMCRVYGASGYVDAHYDGKVTFKSKEDGLSGNVQNLYASGAEANIASFHESITRADCSNPTVAPSVRSNLTTILGRMAAYRQEAVSWENMLRSGERFEADLRGMKA